MPSTPPFQPDPKLYPFRSRWLESRTGGRVHYVDEGEGPTILLLHGNPTWSFLFRGMMTRLRKRFRCIALDYPGFGLSDHPEGYGYAPQEHADVVLELVRFLDLRDLTILGHDWGGPIGLRTALDAKPRVRSLVMGNTWFWPVEDWHMKAFAFVGSSDPGQGMIVKRNALVERLLPWGCEHELPDEVMEHYRRPFPSRESREGAATLPRMITGASFWLEELAYAVPRLLADIPLLLLWGENDKAFPPRFMDRWRDDFHDVTEVRLEAKHYFPEDAPAEAAEAVTTFLDALEARERGEVAGSDRVDMGADADTEDGEGTDGERGRTRDDAASGTRTGDGREATGVADDATPGAAEAPPAAPARPEAPA